MTTSTPLALRRRRTLGEHESPEWVRISAASAIALGFRSGRFSRDFAFGGINLLLNYGDGCRSDCGYCGLARTRPGDYEDKSFIRVEWPLVRTDDLVERMAMLERRLTRLCISMVTSPYAFEDTCEITERIRARVRTPLSILVAPPTLNRRKLERFRRLGVDMIGIGLDAVTEQLFRSLRTDVPAGGAGLSWAKYWQVVDDARELFGPWKVNCHTVVGLGERDRDLIELFVRLLDRQILPYLFCFNPEPDSRMGAVPKTSITRWRRIQLAKHLIEHDGFGVEDFSFDDAGSLVAVRAVQRDTLLRVANEGLAFMTNGCPGEDGSPGCTRPYGSYRASEPFRDFPFRPTADDLEGILRELNAEALFVE
ncbi:Radical SAM domain protein [Acidimicrobium ferrooxidans DSM 10331]|uniref:Radical SAM domain protein n=1 Tax=Acidimicrobium ferrooxidans (strain DSM 10331 / JCM 15462 / NBRC 103882 / ICP) TaxID=525909 RepID=C7LZ29_ACIFD|nr:radical SAM protein [Acidimicrobium ferrooxidans]ACU53987.1 Radical SAM domain protein [Acidimicrobium ferrooxidans DSM 10331]